MTTVYRALALLSLAAMSLLPVPIASARTDSAPDGRTGFWNGRAVTYQVIDGRAYQGDIILGPAEMISARANPPGNPEAPVVAYSRYLWPKVDGMAAVYYTINSQSGDLDSINAAISQFNADFTGVIQWVPRTNQTTWVDINLNGGPNGQCEAQEGYQPDSPQPQPMGGASNCTVATILHEMGHVVGLWHEQSRPDRDAFVTVNYQNIIKGSRSNFDILQDNIQNQTLYDYASVMQYPAFVQSRNGGPTLETIPPGIPLQGTEGVPVVATDYSPADQEAILRLYGTPPTAITVNTNPAGLVIIVDGTNCNAPCVETWDLGSQHTLEVSADVQSVPGTIAGSGVPTTYYYVFGNWNDRGTQGHTVTTTAGNGAPGFPTNAPAVSTYTASFVQLVPYDYVTFPTDPVPGTVSVSPQPQPYPGVSGNFLVARQQATLTATPNDGWNFYDFNSVAPYFWLPGGLGANPKTFYVPDTGNPVDLNVEFTQAPVYTVDVQPNPTIPNPFSSNLLAIVDGAYWPTPKNFSPDPALDGSAWDAATSHILNIDQYQLPYSINSEFVFANWNQGGSTTMPLNPIDSLPATGTSYVASVRPAFQPANNWTFSLPCGAGSAPTVSPNQPPEANGNYYRAETNLTFQSQTPVSGWIFAGWTYDLTGTANPATLNNVADESLVFANYNIAGTDAPLTLTSLSPTTAASGGSGFTLTLNGTGFSPNSLVSVNGTFRSVTYVSRTQLQVPVSAADIATPTAFQVFVENFPPGSTGCAVFAYLPFFVYQGT